MLYLLLPQHLLFCHHVPATTQLHHVNMTLTLPHLNLMPIVGKPNNNSLKLLTKEIYANAHAIPSTCGGSGHRHLGLVMPVAKYLIVSSVAFQLPVHSGPVP